MSLFQSTRPVWGATPRTLLFSPFPVFQSTRPVWGATLRPPEVIPRRDISIHAPRVGRDPCSSSQAATPCYFNPRAPCGARRPASGRPSRRCRFQSTRPVWGATVRAEPEMVSAPFQSTRPVWGATFVGRSTITQSTISIHAPRVGRDLFNAVHAVHLRNFNPRAPCGARRFCTPLPPSNSYFNPRAPCGARPRRRPVYSPIITFQSTRPVWGATLDMPEALRLFVISIHAPRVGRDLQRDVAFAPDDISIHAPRVGRDAIGIQTARIEADFNPRAPCGARPSILAPQNGHHLFQSTRPVWGATVDSGDIAVVLVFQSTRPVWGATRAPLESAQSGKFQSTRPVWGATRSCRAARAVGAISIHAPRVGRDVGWSYTDASNYNFNPRAPCGARRSPSRCDPRGRQISIHAPRVGRDVLLDLLP